MICEVQRASVTPVKIWLGGQSIVRPNSSAISSRSMNTTIYYWALATQVAGAAGSKSRARCVEMSSRARREAFMCTLDVIDGPVPRFSNDKE